MAIPRYLAMTPAEIQKSEPLPAEIAWMSCYFSPYTTGLSNRPASLPPNSVLILNDLTPIHSHDPEVIAAQLTECVQNWKCSGVLLDFQRTGVPETASLSKILSSSLPCPVAVSEPYAVDLDGPIFLPPIPHHVPLAEYLAPWQGREIWLELALDAETITLTGSGADITPLPPGESFREGHREKNLHCHYKIALEETAARFTLWRTREDLDALLEEAEKIGVSCGVGLYQELGAELN